VTGTSGSEFERSVRCQSGAAAVEFAFIFPILFLLMYGTVVYSYVFVVQQSLHYAAQELAEAAVKVDPQLPNADAVREANVRANAQQVLRWMPDSQLARVIGTDGSQVQVVHCEPGGANCPPDSSAVRITLNFSLMQPEPLFPVLNIFLIGNVPPLPERLTASAMARV
jgi:hypothetical protein